MAPSSDRRHRAPTEFVSCDYGRETRLVGSDFQGFLQELSCTACDDELLIGFIGRCGEKNRLSLGARRSTSALQVVSLVDYSVRLLIVLFVAMIGVARKLAATLYEYAASGSMDSRIGLARYLCWLISAR